MQQKLNVHVWEIEFKSMEILFRGLNFDGSHLKFDRMRKFLSDCFESDFTLLIFCCSYLFPTSTRTLNFPSSIHCFSIFSTVSLFLLWFFLALETKAIYSLAMSVQEKRKPAIRNYISLRLFQLGRIPKDP